MIGQRSSHPFPETVPGRPLVISYGGGVNSAAMLFGMHERGQRPDAIVFSDTKGEKPETYESIKLVAAWCEANGFPPLLTITRSQFGISRTGDESLEAECLRLGTLPSRAYGFGTCADKWKIDPFKWWTKTWPDARAAWDAGGVVVRAIGYDAGETRRVSEHADKGYGKWYPLLEWGWGRDECIEAIGRAGVPVPPKSACFYCPASTKSEIIQLGRKHPDLAARAVALESRALATGRWNVKGLGRRFAWKDVLAASEEQLGMFPEAPVEPCMVCVDEDGEAA